MTKKTKILLLTSLIIVILLTIGFFFFVIRSNLRGPLNNEYLSDNELIFVDSLKNNCNCMVKIEKDYEVETRNEKNGTVYIQFNYNKSKINFCISDSISLLENSRKIFHVYESILTKKDAYEIIAINYYSSSFGDRSETPTCDRTFYFDIATKNYFDYTESNRNLRIKESSKQNYRQTP